MLLITWIIRYSFEWKWFDDRDQSPLSDIRTYGFASNHRQSRWALCCVSIISKNFKAFIYVRTYMDYTSSTKQQTAQQKRSQYTFFPSMASFIMCWPFLKIFTSNRDFKRYKTWLQRVFLSHCAIRTSESFFFCCRWCSAKSSIYYTKLRQIGWSCLLSVVPFSRMCN